MKSMKGWPTTALVLVFIFCTAAFPAQGQRATTQRSHSFNETYTGKYLDPIAFPIGGIGAGLFCMDGTRSLAH